MNRFCVLAFSTVLLAGLVAVAQQSATLNSNGQQESQSPQAQADQHLRILSQELNLSAEQQAKVRPILQRFLGQRQQILQDQNLTEQQRRTQVEALHEQAKQEFGQYLNDDQKKKFEQMQQAHTASAHPDTHN